MANQIRASSGKGTLKQGPVSMLQNAMAHNRAMSGSFGFEHQPNGVATQEKGCEITIPSFGGENIAFADNVFNEAQPAGLMKQWEDSEFHLPTILRNQEWAAVGIYDVGSRTWGTALFGSGNIDPSCAIVGGGSEGDGGDGGSTRPMPPTTEGGGGGRSTPPPPTPTDGGGGGGGNESTREARRAERRDTRRSVRRSARRAARRN